MSISKVGLLAAAGGAGQIVPFDLANYEEYNTTTQEIYLSALEPTTTQVWLGPPYFSPDGTKIVYADQQTDKLVYLPLSTAWDLKSTPSNYGKDYINNNSYQLTDENSSYLTVYNAIQFKPDGTKLYVLDQANMVIRQWNLSTAWDLSTASYSTKVSLSGAWSSSMSSWFLISELYAAGEIFFFYDKTNNRFLQWYLYTAWDISTLSPSGVSGYKAFSNDLSSTYNDVIFFQYNGNGFIATLANTSDYQPLTRQFSMQINDISTASYVRSISQQTDTGDYPYSYTGGTASRRNFLKFGGSNNEYIFNFSWLGAISRQNASANFNLTFSSSSTDPVIGTSNSPIPNQTNDPMSVFVKSDGTQYFWSRERSSTAEVLYEYSVPTAWAFDENMSFSDSGNSIDYGSYTYGYEWDFKFERDGSECAFLLADTSGTSYEVFRIFQLTTAWSLSSYLTIEVDADVYPGTGYNPRAFYSSKTNSRLYVFYSNNYLVEFDTNNYTMSAATETHRVDLSSSLGTIYPTNDNVRFWGFNMSPNGRFIYVIGDAEIFQFILGTSWDLSTIVLQKRVSFGTSIKINPEEINIFFDDDGDYMIAYSQTFRKFRKFTLKT